MTALGPDGRAGAPRDLQRRGPLAAEDVELLRAAIDRHAAAIYRLALSIVRDGALADDVVQETLIKAWRFAPIDAHGSIPPAWLARVARNTAVSMLRRRRETLLDTDVEPEIPAGGGDPTAREAEGRDALERLRAAIGTLDPDARALVVLREIDGLSYEEIAATLELPLSTVKTRLFRARQQLKNAVEAWR